MNVNVFSREDFIKINYSDSEYYVCINSSGGPDSNPLLLKNSKNVINLWFDDVNADEYKWGSEVNHWFAAKAITYSQANSIYKFLEDIPFNATVNIYCSKGVSRSGAVAEYLNREKHATIKTKNPLLPNKRVLAYLMNAKYKYIQLLNYKFNFDRLKEYYFCLENNYSHLKWTLDYINEVNDADKHKLHGVYGWGIQSNLEDLTKPCPPYDIHKTGSLVYKNTEMVFGFAKELLDRFPYARQLGIAVHPTDVCISEHVDNDEYVKIHFPIIATAHSYFCFGEHCYILEPGFGYLIDTRYPHSTNQQGSGIRAHFLLKLPVDKIYDALK
jgi:predicted protein tyrosine phosphatase